MENVVRQDVVRQDVVRQDVVRQDVLDAQYGELQDRDDSDSDDEVQNPDARGGGDAVCCSNWSQANSLCLFVVVAVVLLAGGVSLALTLSTPSPSPSPPSPPTPTPSPLPSSVSLTSAVLPPGSLPNALLTLQLFKMLQLAVKGAVTSLCAEFGVKGGVWLNATDWNKTTNPLNNLTVFDNTVCAMGETPVDLVNGLTRTNFSLYSTSNVTIDVIATGSNGLNQTTPEAYAQLFWTKLPPTPAPTPSPTPSPTPPTPSPTPSSAVAVSASPLSLQGLCFPGIPCNVIAMFKQMNLTMRGVHQALVWVGTAIQVPLVRLPPNLPSFLRSMNQVGNLLNFTANSTSNLMAGMHQVAILLQASVSKFPVTFNVTDGHHSATATAPVTISGVALRQRGVFRPGAVMEGEEPQAQEPQPTSLTT